MSDKTGTPIEFFTSVQANSILQIALQWKPNEVQGLRQFVRANFENILTEIQRSPTIKWIAHEVLGQNLERQDKQLTPQEIIKIRKAILSLLDRRRVDEVEESSEEHASPKLTKTGAIIQGLYTNWTYFSNTKLLATSIHDFCEEWVKKSLDDSEELNRRGVALKTSTAFNDEDDDDFWDDEDDDGEVCPGDVAVIKVIPAILQSYINFLDKHENQKITELLQDTSELVRFRDMAGIAANMKRLLMNTKLAGRLKNGVSYNFEMDTRKILNEMDAYSLFLPKK